MRRGKLRLPKKSLRLLLARLVRFLAPTPPLGGLEVSDGALRFLAIKSGSFLLASLRIPPGIVLRGEVKDRANFVSALRNLHEQVAPSRKAFAAIVLLPPEDIYVQPFSLPVLAESQVEEAARLNLDMISPLGPEKMYAGWEEIGEVNAEGGQVDFIGAFAERERVDEIVGAAKKAGFDVAAVEFPALALVRAITELSAVPFRGESYLMVQATDGGLVLVIARHKHLYFHEFRSWSSILEETGAREISFPELRDFIAGEVRRVLNFYGSRWGGTLSGALVSGSGLVPELVELLKSDFGLMARPFILEDAPDLESTWFSALGAAWRGLIPRSSDRFLNLAAESVRRDYEHARFLNFTGLWQKIMFTALGFVFVIFLASDSFSARRLDRIGTELRDVPFSEEREINDLENRAKEFNRLVAFATFAKERSIARSPLFQKVTDLAGSSVTVKRLLVQDDTVTVNGLAPSELSAIAFKNRLGGEPGVRDVALPVTNIRVNPNGTVEFTLTFVWKG